MSEVIIQQGRVDFTLTIDAIEVMRAAREERLARLGPFVEMYGDGSELLRMVDACMRAQARGELPGWVVIAEGRSEPSVRPLRELLLAGVQRTRAT